VVVWAISPDPSDKLAAYADKYKLGYPLLSDPDLAVITSYGLERPDSKTRVPHPTALVIDQEGVIRYRRIDVDYVKRPSPAELIEAIDEVRASE
jgi:peroxiredoxin